MSKKYFRIRKTFLLISFKFMEKIFNNKKCCWYKSIIKQSNLKKKNWSEVAKFLKNCKFSTVIWTNINPNWNEKKSIKYNSLWIEIWEVVVLGDYSHNSSKTTLGSYDLDLQTGFNLSCLMKSENWSRSILDISK